jgi:tRNA(Ile)-lysidine synthetase-like protein
MRGLDADRLTEVRRMLDGAGPAGLMLPGGWTVRMREGTLCVEPAADGLSGGASGATGAVSSTRAPCHDGTVAAATVAPAGTAAHTAAAAPVGVPDAVVLECPGRTPLPDGREVLCRVEPFDPAAFEAHCRNHPTGEEWMDADQVRGRLLCRPRRPGDRFVPLGAPGRQSVSDFLTNLKVPPDRREAVRCICDELGIVYVAPIRIDDRVKVTERSKQCLHIRFAGEPPNGQSG